MKEISFLMLVMFFSKYLIAQHSKIDSFDRKVAFTDFVNNSRMAINHDLEKVRDKRFVVRIPKGLQKNKQITSNYFLHLLNFNKGQRIILLYKPFDIVRRDTQALNISCIEFEELCSEVGLLDELKGIKMLRNRRFGLNVFSKEHFFVVYLNTKLKKVEIYNYAINSIRFLPENID
jgi:hypothetical protein